MRSTKKLHLLSFLFCLQIVLSAQTDSFKDVRINDLSERYPYESVQLSGSFRDSAMGSNRNFLRSEKIFINSVPSDAVLIIGDSLVGRTPLYLGKINESLIISKPGYKPLSLMDIETRNMNLIRLEALPGNNSRSNFFKSNLFKILSGGLVILGGVSAYTKIKADRYFEQYQAFGFSGDLSQTRKYDLISGISFGLMQLNLGYIIYNFLIAEN